MSPVLIDSIRQRMREQTTEQLLELWVTNDRVMWSAEAFEAVKSLLAERGVKELPRQNDPAPIATSHSPVRDPVARYWLGWLRPLLWICIVVSTTSLPRIVGVLWAVTRSPAFAWRRNRPSRASSTRRPRACCSPWATRSRIP